MLVEVFFAFVALVCLFINIILLFVKGTPKLVCVLGILFGLCAFLSSVSLVCIGKGNEDWNYSAPHGAGRIMSRAEAKKKLSLEEFKNQMSDVWSSSVNEDTLDEAPMAYKNIEDIVSNIGDTVEVIKTIKPIYNFKASE